MLGEVRWCEVRGSEEESDDRRKRGSSKRLCDYTAV